MAKQAVATKKNSVAPHRIRYSTETIQRFNDRMYEVQAIARNSMEPGMSAEQELYYFFTISYYEEIPMVYIMDFLFLNYSLMSRPEVLRGLKTLSEMIK